MPEEYQGHPSHAHWNVALWVANDEPLYRLAMALDTAESFARAMAELCQENTPDGVRYTPELLEYAWDSVHEE